MNKNRFTLNIICKLDTAQTLITNIEQVNRMKKYRFFSLISTCSTRQSLNRVQLYYYLLHHNYITIYYIFDWVFCLYEYISICYYMYYWSGLETELRSIHCGTTIWPDRNCELSYLWGFDILFNPLETGGES